MPTTKEMLREILREVRRSHEEQQRGFTMTTAQNVALTAALQTLATDTTTLLTKQQTAFQTLLDDLSAAGVTDDPSVAAAIAKANLTDQAVNDGIAKINATVASLPAPASSGSPAPGPQFAIGAKAADSGAARAAPDTLTGTDLADWFAGFDSVAQAGSGKVPASEA